MSFWKSIFKAIPVVGDVLSVVGALSSAKSANKATNQQQSELDWQREQYNKYQVPQLEWANQQLEAQKPAYNQAIGWQTSLMNGSNEGLPWYMQTPQTSGSEWDSLVNSLSTLSNLNLADTANTEAMNSAKFNASRGTPMSQEQAHLLPGFQRFMNTARASETANRTLKLNDIATSRRAEGQNVLANVQNYLKGNQVNTTPIVSQGTNISNNAANVYGNTATNSANSSSALFSALGNYLGQMAAQNKVSNPYTGVMGSSGTALDTQSVGSNLPLYNFQTQKTKAPSYNWNYSGV